MAALYIQAYQEMLSKYPGEFAAFREIHDKYKVDQDNWKTQFDEIGKPVLRIVEDTENRLCQKIEGSSNSKYAANLAEKFRQIVRDDFPLIDLVGVTIS